MSQLKTASEVKGIQSLAVFNIQQLENMTKLSQQMNEDSHKLTAMTQKFIKDVDHLIAKKRKSTTLGALLTISRVSFQMKAVN